MGVERTYQGYSFGHNKIYYVFEHNKSFRYNCSKNVYWFSLQ
jgi:hypothetical protein